MIATLILLVSVGACIGVVASRVPPMEAIDPTGSRAQAARRSEMRLAGTLMAVATFACFSLMALSYGATWPLVPLIIGLAVAFGLLYPWSFVRLVLIPAGAARAANVVSRLGGHPWVRDPTGGAALATALAIMRARTPDGELITNLRVQLAGAPLRGAGLVAAGLLAAATGERHTARALLSSLDDLDPDVIPPRARQIAIDWLVADAARRGRWRDVVDLAATSPVPTRTIAFIMVCAQRLLGEPVPTAELVRLWLAAPRRRRTWSLLRMAMRKDDPVPHEPVDDSRGLAANDGGTPGLTAMSMHLGALTTHEHNPLTQSAVEQLGKVWDQTLFDYDFRRQVRTRALALDCDRTPDRIVADLHNLIARDIGRMLTRIAPLKQPRGIVRKARLELEDAQLETIEAMCEELARGREAEVVPRALDVWQTWLALRSEYDRTPWSQGRRRYAYALLEGELARTALWLWQDRNERGLANAISIWLLAEAERTNDRQAAAHHRHVIAAGV